MTAYYPSQSSVIQPVVYAPSRHHSHHSHHPTEYTTSYVQPVQYVPSQPIYAAPQVVTPVPNPQVLMQPAYPNGYYNPYQLSLGERLRRFLGLAPRGPFKYRHNKGTWGFMGYSKRPRYTDAYTGAEVDREGRPVLRV